MTTSKILVADSISQSGIDELARDGAFEVSTQTGLSESALVKIIPEFTAVVVRSQTKITADVLNAGAKLRVVGRAGIFRPKVRWIRSHHGKTVPKFELF